MEQRVLHTVDVGGRPVTVALDHDPAPQRRWVILRGRAIDELTERPASLLPVVTTATPGLRAHAAAGGLFGLAGVASSLVPRFVPPDPPGTVNVTVQFAVRAPGYLPVDGTRTVALPVVDRSELDSAFAPLDLGDIALHREPVAIRGRTARAVGNQTEPVAATVTIRRPGIWRSLPSVAASDPPENPDIVALHPPLIRPRTAGALRRRPLVSAGVPLKTLLEPVPAGASELVLSNRVGLLTGHLLQLDEDNSDLTEWHEVAALEGAGTAAQPARVHLTLPLAFAHRESATARRMTPQAAGPNKALTRPAIAGDVTLYLANQIGLAATDTVEIDGGGAPIEYHRLHLYTATSGADGYFRWPPLSRVAQLEIEADRGGGQPLLHRRIAPAYDAREQVVDLIFGP